MISIALGEIITEEYHYQQSGVRLMTIDEEMIELCGQLLNDYEVGYIVSRQELCSTIAKQSGRNVDS